MRAVKEYELRRRRILPVSEHTVIYIKQNLIMQEWMLILYMTLIGDKLKNKCELLAIPSASYYIYDDNRMKDFVG